MAQPVQTEAGEKQLKDLITRHVELTGSSKGKAILDDWANALPRFHQLVPPSEKGTPEVTNVRPVEVLTGAPANGQAPPENGSPPGNGKKSSDVSAAA
jgi:hypothetical protein